MSYILWQPELLDNPAFCALMDESPEYLGLWFRCLQVANAAQRDGDLVVFGGRPLTPKSLAQAHFRRADPETLALAAGFLELAVELGLLEQEGEHLVVAWWADFSKGLSETRDAWRQRKADQRARARGAAQPPAPPVPETQPPPVPGQSRDVPPESRAKQPNNQTTNQHNQARDTWQPRQPVPSPRPRRRQSASGPRAPESRQ